MKLKSGVKLKRGIKVKKEEPKAPTKWIKKQPKKYYA